MTREICSTLLAELFLTMTGSPLDRVKVEKEARFSFAKAERPSAPKESPSPARGRPGG